MSENDSNKKGGWFSGIFSSILSRGTQDRKRPRRSEEVEEEPTHSTSTIDSIVVNEPKRMRSDLSIREGPKSLRTSSLATADGPQRLYSESHNFTDRPNISYSKFVHSRVQDESINEPLLNSTIELYPSSASRSIDFRSKILQPPSRTQQILNELERISSPKPNISKLPSLKRWEELEEWSHDPTKYKSPLPPKKSLFTPTRLHEITARYARGSPKPYWRRPFFNNSWAARQDQSSLATSIEKPVVDEDVQILEPSTSRASADKQTPVAETTAATTFGGLRKTPEQTTTQVTKTTSLFSTTTTEERRIPTLLEERRPHVPVLKGPSGRNVAPNLKSNVFKVPDEDLVVEREEINENDLSKVKPLPFKPSIPAGFLTSQNDQQFAFSFSQPIEREPKAIFSQDLSNEKLFEKQTLPERKNGPTTKKVSIESDKEEESTSPSESDASESITLSSDEEDQVDTVKATNKEDKLEPSQFSKESPKITGAPAAASAPKGFSANLFAPKPAAAASTITFGSSTGVSPTTSAPAIITTKPAQTSTAGAPQKWNCKDCWVPNESTTEKCVCCGSANPNSIAAEQPKKKWECKECWVMNEPTAEKCVCCGAASPSAPVTAAASAPKVFSANLFAPKPAGAASTFSFGLKQTATTEAAPAPAVTSVPIPSFSFGGATTTTTADTKTLEPPAPVKLFGSSATTTSIPVSSSTTETTTPASTVNLFGQKPAAVTFPPATFNFGSFKQPTTTTPSTTAVEAQPSIPAISAPNFLFGATNTVPTPNTAAPATITLFGTSAPVTTTTPTTRTTEVSQAVNGFNLAAPADKPLLQFGASAQPTVNTTTTQPQVPAFSFGSSTTSAPATTSASAPFQFSSGSTNNASTAAFNFAAAPPTTDKPTFQFGASEPAQASSNQSIGFNFGGATTAGSTPFQFSAAKPASSAGFNFAAPTDKPAVPAFQFGSSMEPAQSQPPALFNFSGAATTGVAPFQFGSAANVNPTPAFNGSSSAPNLQALANSFNPQPSINGSNPAASLFAPEPGVGGRKIRHAVRKYGRKF
uniref:Nuclear pore complex protein Nup153 n=1 Tax=Acrobeloides nanus TaxID=290746 RepID=A0A914E9L6_9BILA